MSLTVKVKILTPWQNRHFPAVNALETTRIAMQQRKFLLCLLSWYDALQKPIAFVSYLRDQPYVRGYGKAPCLSPC